MIAAAHVHPIAIDGFSAELEPPYKVRLRGRLTVQNPETLVLPFFRSIHDHALATGAREIEIDLLELGFFSSSAIRAMLAWLGWVQALDEPQRYALAFRGRASATWQTTTLDALRELGQGVVTVRMQT
jgi:hypothetical protein